MQKLQEYVTSLATHAAKCSGNVILVGEKRDGLFSIISTRCSVCTHTIILETSKKVKGQRGYSRWDCNHAAIWGQMCTGGGHSKLRETMAVLGVPVMSPRQFISTERDIGMW